MRQFWTLLALGVVGFLTGTIGMALQSRTVAEESVEVLTPATAVDAVSQSWRSGRET